MDKFKHTLLIVDDTEINLDLLSDIFKDSYNILTADSGEKALEIMKSGADIDVVLLDIVMPNMDGYSVLENMRNDERLKFLPVVVITAYDDMDAECKVFELGAVDFITRPFNAKAVEKRVDSVIYQHELEEIKAENQRLKNEAESEKHLSALMENLLGGIVLCEQDENGNLKVVHCSKGLSYMMGCSEYDKFMKDLTENPTARVVNTSDIAEFKSIFEAAVVSGQPIEYSFKCLDYDNKLIWIHIHGQITKNDKGSYALYSLVTDITKEREYEIELKTGVYFDHLTGAYNRNAFFVNARKLIEENPDIKYAVMRFNIGNFKLINDIMGREVGDKVLISVADTLSHTVGSKGLLARFFADSFVIIAPYNEANPETIIENIKNNVKNSEIIPHDVQYYAGVYIISNKSTRIEDICDRALIACRSITGSFNKHVAYYDDRMRLQMLEEQEICDEAHRALANGEFCVYYQSVYGIKAKKFVSAEALVRWKHPTKGIIPPGKFIPVFERNGFIAELDLYILEQVCKYQQKRIKLGLPQFPISVNISRLSLYNPNLFDIISSLTDKYGVTPQSFRIEITETAYNDNPAQLLETIDKLREKCYPILMDDFGSGYSSLNTLKDIPIDILKLDMKFMQGFEKNSRVGTIVTSVARMSKWLNVPMLAEGVETKEQYDFLESIGCAYIQGYYFSKPICEEEFTRLISEENIAPLADTIETYGINDDINEILGSNPLVSKLISGAFGGFGIYELSNDRLEVIRVNEGYMQIMGYAPSDFKGEHSNVWEQMVPEDIPKSQQACFDAWNSNNPVRALVRRYDKDGKLLYLDGIHRRLGGTDENPIFCIAFNDITEQIESDRIIRQSKDQINKILDATGAIVVDIDYVGNSTYCAGDTDEYGFDVYELAEMIKSEKGLYDIAHFEDRDKVWRFQRSKSANRISADFRIRNVDGNYTWCRFTKTQTFDENGNLTRLMGIFNNIDTEKKTAEELINEQHRSAYQINQIVSNFDCGLGLISKTNNSILLQYANDKFFGILNISKSDSKQIAQSLKDIIEMEIDNIDMDIKSAYGENRIAKIHRSKIDSTESGKAESYIVVVEDVTLKRAEAKNRIAERKRNALMGLYDAVFKVDYRVKTSLLVSSRSNPQKAKHSRPLSLDYVIGEWTEQNIHPDDKEKARTLFRAPMTNPDFTDSYAEIRMVIPHTGNQFKTFGMIMVRSAADVCMLFYRDMSRMDKSTTSDEVAEINRLYRLVAEQTNTTVIEYDHITGKVTVSPSIYMYAAAMLSEKDLVEQENYIKGLAIHPDDRKDYAEFVKKVIKSDDIETITLRMEMADKTFKWCRLSISTNKSSTGEILKSLCTINLVHDEVEARRKAESIDMLMRKTVKHIPVGVGIFEIKSGRPVPLYLSDNTYRIFGIDKEYKNIDLKITQDFMENNKLEPEKESEYTQHCIRPDGTGFWLNTKYYVMEERGSTLLYAAMDDVSEQVETQRSQEVQDQMYQMLLEETGTVVFHYDNESDEFFYYRPSNPDNSKTRYINNYSKCFDEFTLLREEDRVRFASEIKKLSEKPSSSELIVTINVDAYPRRFRCFFKSVEDIKGKVFRIIGKIEDVDDEMNHLEKIKAKAMYDFLCVDIYNKATTEELIRAELERSAGGSLIMIDVDDFKSINDTLGHIFGDEFLKKFATTIKQTFRDSDIVGRYGGDEFFVYLNHANAALALKKAEQILDKIAQIKIPEIGHVKSSIGITLVNPENRNYVQILRQADSALYAAKNRGKNQIVLFDSATMSEGTYRTAEGSTDGKENTAVLSSNPRNSASIIMRIFSALYSSLDLSTGINQMLALAGSTYDVSRAYIFEDTDDGKYCCNTFEWCNDGVTSEMNNLQKISYEEDLGGNYHDNMNDDGIFYCHDINVLGKPQREIFARQSIKSVLQCAIMDKGEFKGFVGFDECRSNRFWTQEQIDALAFISKVLSVFLLKDRNRKLTENYAKSIKSILDNYPQYIYIVEKESKTLLYLNKMAQKAIGDSPIGKHCSDAICGYEDEQLCPINAFQKIGYSKSVDMLSPILQKKIKTQATEVDWEGKKAYLVTCIVIEE